MRPFIIAVAIVSLTSASAAWANNGKGRGQNKIKIHKTQPVQLPSVAGSGKAHCPPGLAKKALPCVPPGQVKQYGVGDYIYDGYYPIDDPWRWGLRRNGYYVRAGDYVYEVSRETHQVLNLIGAVVDILN
ncbi:hypothetical protein [Ruegeria sp. HKCCD8929]|uniref:hypothetical protein n=1 Tax=Ruegeria sp. HKCCD8929 TaxID=2683006 RepID=UPI001489A7BD|nr:hypothetical protein [Ruegeria sp. HKCCD8929]